MSETALRARSFTSALMTDVFFTLQSDCTFKIGVSELIVSGRLQYNKSPLIESVLHMHKGKNINTSVSVIARLLAFIAIRGLNERVREVVSFGAL